MPSRSRVMVAGSAPVSRAAVSVMISYSRTREVQGPAGDGGARRRERAGVVDGAVGVAEGQYDAIWSGVQGGRGDLGVHCGGAVAELAGAHPIRYRYPMRRRMR